MNEPPTSTTFGFRPNDSASLLKYEWILAASSNERRVNTPFGGLVADVDSADVKPVAITRRS